MKKFGGGQIFIKLNQIGILLLMCLIGFSSFAGASGITQTGVDPVKVQGPNKCGECHKFSVEVWKGTHHYSTFTRLPRSKKGREIAKKMGLKRIKADSMCLDCHFTSVMAKSKQKPIAGISCESCHSHGADWIKVHGEYSGKKKETETAAEAKVRWQKSEAAGMIRPHMTYKLAKNCYSCHTVPKEKLVNVGGHPAGSAFELVAWSQGEIRHNVFRTAGKSNPEADLNTKRKFFVIGRIVELEVALRATGKATEKAKYAVSMAKRANAARGAVGSLAKLLTGTPELAQIAKVANAAGLKLNNDKELSAAADEIAKRAKQIATKYDGSSFGAIDKYIPKVGRFKGKPVR